MAPVIHQFSQTIPLPDSTSSALIPGSSGPRTTEVHIRELAVSSSGNSITFTPPASYAFTDDTDSGTSDTSSSNTSSSNTSSSSSSSKESGISGPLKGAIAGSIVGAAFLLLLLYCCYRRSPKAAEAHRRSRRSSNISKDSPDPAAPEPAPAEPKPAPEAEPAEPPPTKKKKTVRIAPGSTPPPHLHLHPHVRTPVKVKVKLYPDSEEAKGTLSSIERYTMDLGAGAHVRIKRGKTGTPIAFISRPREGSEVVV